MNNFITLYDACTLYPAPLRDLLMYLALMDLFRAKWTDDIHNEWISNVLLKRPDLKRAQLERTRDLMNLNVRDCLVEGYHDLMETLHLPDKNDRHVLAAAIKCSASYIITFNLKDFPLKYLQQFGIEAQHPDQFISRLIDAAPGQVCEQVNRLRKSLQHPPKSIDEYLDILVRQSLPQTVSRLSKLMY